MSDRPQGSVRTGTRGDVTEAPPAGADAAPAKDATPVEAPVSATQSIRTGQNRVVQAGPQKPAAVPPPATGERSVPPAAAAGTATATGTSTSAGIIPAKTSARSKAAKIAAGRKPTRGGRGPRRARLQLRHIDTWSAFKISFVLSVALFFIWMVAIGILYAVLSGLGVFNTLNDLFGQLGSASGSKSTGSVITPGIVLGGAAVIGAINIILMTALCTVATFIYNLCSDLVGGLEVTLSERD